MPPRRMINEPVQSDRTILMTVEDLISMALNIHHHNRVNFKMLQMILHILARQLRLLEQRVQLMPDSSDEKEAGRQGSTSPSGRSKRMSRSKSAKRGEAGNEGSQDRKGDKGRGKADGKADKGKSDESTSEDKAQHARDGGRPSRFDRDDRARGAYGGGGVGGGGGGGGGMNIRERDNILYAETDSSRPGRALGRVGSIDVATADQVEALREEVRQLQRLVAPPPLPELPSDEALREGIAAGTASLTDTFNAMQVAARIKAAEQAAGRLAEMVTMVAAAGGIDARPMLEGLMFGGEKPGAHGAQGFGAGAKAGGAGPGAAMGASAGFGAVAGMGAGAGAGAISGAAGAGGMGAGHAAGVLGEESKYSSAPSRVTKHMMQEAINELREELVRNISGATGRASAAVEQASQAAKNVSERLDVATTLSKRITTLQELVADYAEQLDGFGGGLETQMFSFKDQIGCMRTDLSSGLVQLEQVNTNKETLAVLELTERYTGLVTILDETLHEHGGLTADMRMLAAQLQALRAAAESLGEQKADRDEVADGLRDKADLTQLEGLLKETDFRESVGDLEHRLSLCHQVFNRQDSAWHNVLNELSTEVEGKADLTAVIATREEAQRLLRELQRAMQRLEEAVGEPSAALLTRQLALDATCGTCKAPALMDREDPGYGQPPPLPALRPPPPPPSPPEERCDWEPLPQLEDRSHACHRWVGGSHTLLTTATRGPAPPPPPPPAVTTRSYLATGDDGRLYHCEEELQPCLECNKEPAQAHDTGAAGDNMKLI